MEDKKVLPDIIHQNQTGYVKDRFIAETIRSIYLSHCNGKYPRYNDIYRFLEGF